MVTFNGDVRVPDRTSSKGGRGMNRQPRLSIHPEMPNLHAQEMLLRGQHRLGVTLDDAIDEMSTYPI
jgi:hypothetical protein